jgi:hypothetical protein
MKTIPQAQRGTDETAGADSSPHETEPESRPVAPPAEKRPAPRDARQQ